MSKSYEEIVHDGLEAGKRATSARKERAKRQIGEKVRRRLG